MSQSVDVPAQHQPLSWRGPLAGSYWAAVGLVLCALTPFLVLSSATPALEGLISGSVGLGRTGMEMSAGMADAAYCFGTVLAVQLISRLPGRRLLVGFAALFVVASVLTAAASSPPLFFAGRILQGISTSLMLITAAPALVLGFPTRRMRSTAMVMNMGIFGAVALGPVIGGAFAGLADWRLLFWISAGVGAAALALVVLTFTDAPPTDRELRFDPESLALASIGCTAAFFGASSLVDHGFTDAIVLGPLLLGVACIVGLIVHQTFVRDPLMPVRQLGHTIPLAAIALAMVAGAGSVALVGLLQLTVAEHGLSTALFWPEFGGAVVTALLFGTLFFTRWVPLLAFAGLLALAGTGLLLTGAAGGDSTLIAIGAGGVGLGVGASVAPGLFVAGFALPSRQLPRVFALVELLRGVAAFLTAPLLIHLARTTGSDLPDGVRTATWATVALLAAGIVLVAAIALSGRVRLQRPRIESWQQGEGTALDSAPLGAALRRRG
ncbi:MFS transporter [Conexibacter sp. JD483]|uniref:MFS transporter n=1 Tax=unclassified Conexibacter TaxID=2627773 RepID=UPI00272594CE|nr:MULTISPECIES: MFS transporter [unclassified Conexibacter]MDO8188614.1 MFS transporter [Conexibacter sp. CPCC 205706]MDO8201504.1 MFS transporter [Conexibacter sp. CPCC 205762]MDR9370871.1 MFS transporter [Conexibacter sp. JD483]